MDDSLIGAICQSGSFPFTCQSCELQETHISYVILCENDVLKFKKNVLLDFLDFSTLERRHFYCKEEVRLNRRLTDDLYLGVLPVSIRKGQCVVADEHNIIDYAVHMKRMPSNRRMDLLLDTDIVKLSDIEKIAAKLASFHKDAERCVGTTGIDLNELNDLGDFRPEAENFLSSSYRDTIQAACDFNESFLDEHAALLERRSSEGLIRDCHGDLHARNIFLLPEPVIFDCIEFSKTIRSIDLLNEIAFLCMDLEARGHRDLSDHFFKTYNDLNPVCGNEAEYELFLFFKAYRANVRAKVNLIALNSNEGAGEYIGDARLYLDLMNNYISEIAENK